MIQVGDLRQQRYHGHCAQNPLETHIQYACCLLLAQSWVLLWEFSLVKWKCLTNSCPGGRCNVEHLGTVCCSLTMICEINCKCIEDHLLRFHNSSISKSGCPSFFTGVVPRSTPINFLITNLYLTVYFPRAKYICKEIKYKAQRTGAKPFNWRSMGGYSYK